MKNVLKEIARSAAVVSASVLIVKGVTAGADALANWYTVKRAASKSMKATKKIQQGNGVERAASKSAKAAKKIQQGNGVDHHA
jgi:hypothetical protein